MKSHDLVKKYTIAFDSYFDYEYHTFSIGEDDTSSPLSPELAIRFLSAGEANSSICSPVVFEQNGASFISLAFPHRTKYNPTTMSTDPTILNKQLKLQPTRKR